VKVYNFKCATCGFGSRNQVGTLDGDQILTDLNTEFAQYRLFVCRKENKFIHADVLDANFDNKCPSDGTNLEEVDPKRAKCPRCGSELNIQEIIPLAAADSSAE
jgi:ribosomal protein L37E